MFIGIKANAFRYTQGAPRRFTREGADKPPTHEFCGDRGVHTAARSPKVPDGLVVKVGTLDDPAVFEGPKMVFWTQDKHDFHVVPNGATAYATLPRR